MDPKVEKSVVKELKIHGAAMNLPPASVQLFTAAALSAVKKDLKSGGRYTEKDLKRLVARHLRKFNRDFAYIYEKYDTII